MPSTNTSTKTPVDEHSLIEVVDSRNRPLAAMPVNEVHRQGLSHRFVVVLVFDPQNRLFLRKRALGKRIYPGRWDASASGHVLDGEATRDAARRVLANTLGIHADRMRRTAFITPGKDTGKAFVSVYAIERQLPPALSQTDEMDSGYFHTREEVSCLVREFRELLTPGLVHLWENDMAFPHR